MSFHPMSFDPLNSAPKLCRDCVHCHREKTYDVKYIGGIVSTATDNSWKYARCFRIIRLETDLITGKQNISRRGELCSIERRDFKPVDTCGVDAKYFEPLKKP